MSIYKVRFKISDVNPHIIRHGKETKGREKNRKERETTNLLVYTIEAK